MYEETRPLLNMQLLYADMCICRYTPNTKNKKIELHSGLGSAYSAMWTAYSEYYPLRCI